MRRLFGGDAEIGLLHDRRGDHLGRLAVGDELAVVQHDDAVGERAHHVHLVLDQQDGLARVLLELRDQVEHDRHLVDAHAGGRLVEHEDLRLERHHQRDLELALVAMRQRGRGDVARGRRARRWSRMASARAIRSRAAHPGPQHVVMHAAPRLHREADVLDDAQVRETDW